MFNDLSESLKRAVFVFLAVMLFVIALVQMGRELRVFTTGFLYQDQPIPLSMNGQLTVLHTCEKVMSSPYSKMQPTVQIVQISESCKSYASRILEKTPAFSFAHLIAAQAYFNLEDYEKSLASVALSEKFAPGPLWLVERRIDILIKITATHTEFIEDAFSRDITRLLQSDRGAEFLSDRLYLHPTAKPIVFGMIEYQNPKLQHRFLSALRRVAS
ncbi:hypothetical protein [Parasulfitobacter algicola]|uniref:Uncharacterized protein n=1 Tax=Parasulfitobacter algicola TaxID=2614809 RepID=A0ABX2IKY1_9RHOB|nr:hypothetical protein [Sulfitobacter algicola]NSX53519.1 hypothetical protein [Sulfitobacter algicola]